ncbi:DUF2577 family protein [Clostridium sp.]|jgi:hypothetical protein|uniref:DUF2577 family protein n=1 Tax=Clostridium sp. TaxID=1506 RepID=UPI003EEDAB85
MGYDVEMAMELKNRTNVKRTGNLKGEVLSLDPFKVGILNNTVFLQKGNCSICSSLKENYTKNATLEIDSYTVGATATDSRGDSISSINVPLKSDYNAVITYKDVLKKGDDVLVISDALGQYFFIVDKIEVI